ncbi:MAG: hypothetical protein HN919_11040, partial [Verrucomicrobia bacterium]|nr:hypothetical protein [Verrucomicrobiota bacterium]
MNGDGLLAEVAKDGHTSIPHFTKASIVTPDDWKRCKEERFRLDDPARIVDVEALKAQHPDADRLSLCQVDLGEPEAVQIVCGAPNHKQGDLVVVARPGCVLPGNFTIKESQIRGQASAGMMCS